MRVTGVWAAPSRAGPLRPLAPALRICASTPVLGARWPAPVARFRRAAATAPAQLRRGSSQPRNSSFRAVSGNGRQETIRHAAIEACESEDGVTVMEDLRRDGHSGRRATVLSREEER